MFSDNGISHAFGLSIKADSLGALTRRSMPPVSKEPRFCQGVSVSGESRQICGVRLNSYHEGKLCYICERKRFAKANPTEWEDFLLQKRSSCSP